MKKITGFMTFLVLALFLTACSSSDEETRTFELEQDGVKTTMVYTFTDDKVSTQSTENVIEYEAAGLGSKEEAKEIFDPMIVQFENVEGMTHKMEYEDTKAIETLSIDYEAVNFDEIMDLPGMAFSEDPSENGVSMAESAALLENQGFTEVE